MTGRNCGLDVQTGCENTRVTQTVKPGCCLNDPAMHDCCKLLWEMIEEVGPKQEKIIKTFIPKVDAFMN